MTVRVTRKDGVTDEFARFGDCYIKRADGSLDIMRTGAGQFESYAAGGWADVSGDEHRTKTSRLFRRRVE